MAVFNIPKDVDSWLTIQYLILFLMAFAINTDANGRATLIYLEAEYHISPDSPNFYYTNDYKMLQKYSQDVELRNKWVWNICLILYFIISPTINFYFGFFVFKKGYREITQQSLNTTLT
jgi:hypothetical protein